MTTHRTTRLSLVATALLLTACGGAATPAPTTPATPPPAPTNPQPPTATTPPPPAGEARKTPEELFAAVKDLRDNAPVAPDPKTLPLEPWSRAAKVKGVGAPPASCAVYAKRAGAPAKDLPAALAETDASKRDAMLVTLAAKDDLARVIRADLAPVECADTIVDGWLGTKKSVGDRVGHAAVGISIASKLARTAGTPPAMTGARDKAKVLEFIKGPLKTWMVEQATAIEGLSAAAASTEGYGTAVAAVEAGAADLRLVDRIRSAPTPAGWDAELKHAYEAALDEALEPRKRRGAQAAVVGLAWFGRSGSLHDARVDRARGMIAKLYGGRRIDALDGLLLAKWDAPAPKTAEDRAIAAVPVFWSERASFAPKDLAAFGPALARGVPEPLRAAYRADQGPKELRAAYARARFDLGRLSWRRADFVEAMHAAKDGDDKLLYALALTLATGPVATEGENVPLTAMLRNVIEAKGEGGAPLVFGHTEALDALAEDGMAAFDAAHLRSLGAPATDTAAWFKDVAARFRKAEGLLTDPAQKKLAAERAAEAEATAAAAK